MPSFVEDLKTVQEQLAVLAEALRGTPFADSAALLRAQAAADRSVLKMGLAAEKKKRQEAEEELRALRARTALLDACRARPWRPCWAECADAGAGAGAGAGPEERSDHLAVLARLLERGKAEQAAEASETPEATEPAAGGRTPPGYEGDEDLYS